MNVDIGISFRKVTGYREIREIQKHILKKEGDEMVTNCNQMKL